MRWSMTLLLTMICHQRSFLSRSLDPLVLSVRYLQLRNRLSLLFLLNIPLGVSTSYDCEAISTLTVPNFYLSGIYVKSLGSTGDRSRAWQHRSKVYFCFRLSYSSLSTRSFLSWTWGFRATLELGTFSPKPSIHQELCRWIPIGKWSWSVS